MSRLLMLASCAALASCATVTRGTTTAFVVETIPSGAQVELSTGQICEATPCTFARISREAEFTVTVTKDGYETTTHDVTHRTAGAGGAGMAGNVLIGGIIGAAIDANSGATQDLVPNPLVIHMTPVALVATPAAAPAPEAPAAEAPIEQLAPEAAPAESAPAPTQ
jgi:hypothetical protein